MDLAQKPRTGGSALQEEAVLDVSILSVAVTSGVVALMLCIISCICCYKRARRSQDENSESRRDTVPLEDLLSKPSLADPESVFSEASYGGRMSIHTNSWTGLVPDGSSVTYDPVSVSGPGSSSQDSSNFNHSVTVAKAETHTSITVPQKGKSQSQKVIKSTMLLRAKEHDAYPSQRHSTKTQSELAQMLEPAGNELKHAEAVAESIPKKCSTAENKSESSPDSMRKLKITPDKADEIGIDPTGLKIRRDSTAPEKLSFLSSTRCSFSHEVGHIAHGSKVPRTSLPRTEEGDDSGSRGSTPNTPEQHRAAATADITCKVSTAQTLTSCSSTVTINSISTVGGVSRTENPPALNYDQGQTTDKVTKIAYVEVPPITGAGNMGDRSFPENSKLNESLSSLSNASIQADITHSSEILGEFGHIHVPMRRYSSSPQGSCKQDFSGASGKKTFSLNLKIDFHFDHRKEHTESVPVFSYSPIPNFSKHNKESSFAAAYIKDANFNQQTLKNNCGNELEPHTKEQLLEQSFAMKSDNVKSKSLPIESKRMSEPTIMETSPVKVTEGESSRRYSVSESPPITSRKRQSSSVSSHSCKYARSIERPDVDLNISTPNIPNHYNDADSSTLSYGVSKETSEENAQPVADHSNSEENSSQKPQNRGGTPKQTVSCSVPPSIAVTVCQKEGESHENITPFKSDKPEMTFGGHLKETPGTASEESSVNEQLKADELTSAQEQSIEEEVDVVECVKTEPSNNCSEIKDGNFTSVEDTKLHGKTKVSDAQSRKIKEVMPADSTSQNEHTEPVDCNLKKIAASDHSARNLSFRLLKNAKVRSENVNEDSEKAKDIRHMKQPIFATKETANISNTGEDNGMHSVSGKVQTTYTSTAKSSDISNVSSNKPMCHLTAESLREDPPQTIKIKSSQYIKAVLSKKTELPQPSRVDLSYSENDKSSQTLKKDLSQHLTRDFSQPLKTDSAQSLETHSSGSEKTYVTPLLKKDLSQTIKTESSLDPETDSPETARTETMHSSAAKGIPSSEDQTEHDLSFITGLNKGSGKIGRSQTAGAVEGRIRKDTGKRSAMIFEKTHNSRIPLPTDSAEVTSSDKVRNLQHAESSKPVPKPRPAPRELPKTVKEVSKNGSASQKNLNAETSEMTHTASHTKSERASIFETNQEAIEETKAEDDTNATGMSKESRKQKDNSKIPVFYVADDMSADAETDACDDDNKNDTSETKIVERNKNCEMDSDIRLIKSAANVPSAEHETEAASTKIPGIIIIGNSDDDDYDEIEDTKAGKAADVSDESDYDNPWDDLDDAVKRASIRYNRRPSRIAAGDKAILLKSAEDLGRLMEEAEKRRQLRQAAARSTCQIISPEESMTIPFTRFSPLRHTVKGIVSQPQMTTSQSSDNILQTRKAVPPKLSLLRAEEAGENSRGIDARRPQSLTTKVKTKIISPESKKRKKQTYQK